MSTWLFESSCKVEQSSWLRQIQTGWILWSMKIWLVVWNIFYFPIYWVSNHPNWLSYFLEGWPNHQPEMGSTPQEMVGSLGKMMIGRRIRRLGCLFRQTHMCTGETTKNITPNRVSAGWPAYFDFQESFLEDDYLITSGNHPWQWMITSGHGNGQSAMDDFPIAQWWLSSWLPGGTQHSMGTSMGRGFRSP